MNPKERKREREREERKSQNHSTLDKAFDFYSWVWFCLHAFQNKIFIYLQPRISHVQCRAAFLYFTVNPYSLKNNEQRNIILSVN